MDDGDNSSSSNTNEEVPSDLANCAVLENSLREWLVEFNQSVLRTHRSGSVVKTTQSVEVSAERNKMSGEQQAAATEVVECPRPDSDSGDSINSRSDSDEDDHDVKSPSVIAKETDSMATDRPDVFSYEDLQLLVDLFFLPHQHGKEARRLLSNFDWLKQHAPGYRALDIYHKRQQQDTAMGNTMVTNKDEGESSDKVVEWLSNVECFHQQCRTVCKMFARLTAIPNRPLLYDIYQYIWDAKEACMLLESYISWLEAGGFEVRKEGYLPATVEPFTFKGGITAEMQRLLPSMDSPKDLYSQQKAPVPSPLIFTIRPYRQEDKPLVYRVCLETGHHGGDGTNWYPHYPNLLGDRYVGPYITLSQELSFVLEDDTGVCGYVLAALDSRHFYKYFTEKWTPSVINDYPSNADGLTASEKEVLGSLRQSKFFLPAELYDHYPSHLHIDLVKRAQGKGTGGRMIRCVLSALKAKGSCGVHLEMSMHNPRALKFYLKLGFVTLDFVDDAIPDDVVILGRTL